MSINNKERIDELLAVGCDQDTAQLFAHTPLSSREVLDFVENDLGLDHIHLVKTFTISPSDLRKWMDLLFLQTYVAQVLKLGISLEDATRIFKGKVDPERSTVIALLEQGTTIEEVLFLRESGIYFFRTIATPDRPLREVFLDEIFGSKKLREIWELTGATLRDAAYAHRSGLTPLQFVGDASPHTSRPVAHWVLEQKKYDFGFHSLPAVFSEHLGKSKNEGFLKAIGYDVKVRSLKNEFITRINPRFVIYTNSYNGEKALVGFSQSGDKWTSHFLVNGSEDKSLGGDGQLLELGNRVLEVLSSRGLKIKDVKILASLKSLNSELLMALGSWFADYSKEKLPTLNSVGSAQYTTIQGESVLAPKVEFEKRPGRESIVRLGDVVFYSLGSMSTPLVAVFDGTDEDIRAFLADAIAQLPSEAFDEIIINRVFLLDEEEFEYMSEELSSSSSDDSKDKIIVGPDWLVQIWIDEDRISVDEVLNRIEVVGEEFEDDEFVERWDLVYELCNSQDLPTWYKLDHFFLRRPPIFINGRGYAVPRDYRELLLEIDPIDESGLPRIEQLIASYSVIELSSMVSGTDWHLLGFVRADILIGLELLDEGETQVHLWRIESNEWSKYFAEWLLSDVYGFNMVGRYWIESTIGELPDVEQLSADWFDEDLSSTLMVSFGCSTHSKQFDDAVMARLLENEEINRYVVGIRQPESKEGIARASRIELYRAKRM